MRTAIVVWTLAAAFVVMDSAAHGQSVKWPEKPLRIIVATGIGGSDDVTTRTIAPRLSELLGQQFIVDNRPGAGGLIGQSLVLKSPPDGYTLLLAGGSMAGARYVNASVAYDVLHDFTPVSLLQTTQFVMLVHPGVPARNLKEYIRLAQSQAGKMRTEPSARGKCHIGPPSCSTAWPVSRRSRSLTRPVLRPSLI